MGKGSRSVRVGKWSGLAAYIPVLAQRLVELRYQLWISSQAVSLWLGDPRAFVPRPEVRTRICWHHDKFDKVERYIRRVSTGQCDAFT